MLLKSLDTHEAPTLTVQMGCVAITTAMPANDPEIMDCVVVIGPCPCFVTNFLTAS